MDYKLVPLIQRNGKAHGPGFYHPERLAQKPVFATVRQEGEGPVWEKIRNFLINEWMANEAKAYFKEGKPFEVMEPLYDILPYKCGGVIDSLKRYIECKREGKEKNFLEVKFHAVYHPDIYHLYAELEQEEGIPITKLRAQVCRSFEEQIPSFGGIPSSIGLMTNLVELDIACSFLDSLPDEVGNLIHLEVLHAECNRFTQDPPCISRLSNLRTLKLYNNCITSLSEDFGKLKNLTSLDLTNNKITSINDSFSGLESLKYLRLNENQIRHVPRCLGLLPNLIKLNLRLNFISEISDHLACSKSLTEINFEGQKMEKFPHHLLDIPTIQEVLLEPKNPEEFRTILESDQRTQEIFYID